MKTRNFIQVFEHQKLKIGEGAFQRSHFDSLVKFNEKQDNKYFTPIYNGIQFGSYVGVLHVGGLTIEILPKADKSDSPDKALWQNVLLNMLRVCRKMEVDTVTESNLKQKNNSILDVYLSMFLDEVERLVKKGLIRKYRRVTDNQLSLKGKLNFSQDIQKNLIHKEKFYCEHELYDKNHQLHQILFQGVRIVDSLSSHLIADKAKRLLYEFDGMGVKNFGKQHFERLTPDRKTAPYQKALSIAKMLILNYSPNLNAGSEEMIALLFDMNQLWEEYVYRVLHRHSGNEYTIDSQQTTKFWENKTIRPDIVVTNNRTKETYIIDTKWKIVSDNKPSDEDLKQIFTYNIFWRAKKSILLYPKTIQNDTEFGTYHHKPYHKIDGEYSQHDNFCKLGFISVVDGSNLKELKAFSDEILRKTVQ